MPELLDPPEPPEGGSGMRAADLINKVCVFHPTAEGEWPAKPAGVDEHGNRQEAKGPQPFVSCRVWVLDRAGVLEEGDGVRVSWWKAVEQLRPSLGSYVGGKPMQEEGGRAVVLRALEGEARAVAARVIGELDAAESDIEDGTEQF